MHEPCQAHVTLNAIGVGTLWCMSCTEVYHAGSLFSSNNCVTFSLCCSLTQANTIIFSWPCASFSCPPQAEQGEMWACVSVCVIVCVNVCVCVCVCEWVYVHMCVCVCVCVCDACVYMFVRHVRMCIYIHACVWTLMHVCVCVCVHACVCVYVILCVCVFLGGWGGTNLYVSSFAAPRFLICVVRHEGNRVKQF